MVDEDGQRLAEHVVDRDLLHTGDELDPARLLRIEADGEHSAVSHDVMLACQLGPPFHPPGGKRCTTERWQRQSASPDTAATRSTPTSPGPSARAPSPASWSSTMDPVGTKDPRRSPGSLPSTATR